MQLLAPTVVRRLNEELGDGTVTVIDVLGPARSELEARACGRSATAAARATPTADRSPVTGRPSRRLRADLRGPGRYGDSDTAPAQAL